MSGHFSIILIHRPLPFQAFSLPLSLSFHPYPSFNFPTISIQNCSLNQNSKPNDSKNWKKRTTMVKNSEQLGLICVRIEYTLYSRVACVCVRTCLFVYMSFDRLTMREKERKRERGCRIYLHIFRVFVRVSFLISFHL